MARRPPQAFTLARCRGDCSKAETIMNEFRLIIQPDEDDAESAQVFVDGTVGGKCYRFLLDTGAARTSLILDDYTSTFESAAKHASSGLFATNSDDLIVVPNLEVGP